MKNDDLPEQSTSQIPSSPQPATNFTQPVPTPTVNPVPNPKNKLLLITGIVVLLALFSGVAYYLGAKGTKVDLTSNKQQSQEQPTSNPIPTTTVSQTPLFSGQLKRLSQNLQIFKSTEDDKLNGIENNFVYYDAGKFNQGELKDYTRIMAIRPSRGPGQPLTFTLATKDFQNYVLDDPDNKTTKYPADDWQNPYNFLDKSKITSTRTFETEQSREIDLNQNFALYLEELSIENVPTNRKDKNGSQIDDTPLTTNFASYQKLTSPFNNLTIYFKPYEQNNTYYNQLSQSEKEKFQLRQKYLLGDTEVIVVDSVGLPIVYAMTTPGNVKIYNNKQAQYEIAWKTYQEQLKKFQNKEISQYPQSPDYVYLPTLGFSNSQINSQNNLKFFNNYKTAVPGACATSQNSRVINVSDSDLEQIGSVSNLPLYRLKDTNNPLYALAYKNKLEYSDQDPTSWDQVNKGIQKPTLEEYISQSPLLFVKNYWQQWVALGEFDIKLPGGCGKPVVYLYPTQPTDVTVKFEVPVQLTTDIPKYADFWQVKAYPNGSLVNLKPEFTNCQQIDVQQKGSEYAKQACQINTYPYLFWAGNVVSRNYPTIKDGWIVDRKDLGSFLNEKLIGMGLSDTERKDFTNYWLADMLEKNAPYYRISFLQTDDLNRLFPMTVDPKPDTSFRIFLDYSALTEKPEQLPQPQNLNRLVRKGFTLVEWGGLKQP
ncbi:MAG: hypothetical protein M1150_03650 [Patescibacteria group bacterium]|nr:hypothetical protein [Patescibacteria group bacterium]